jgi:hypothetical protein
LTEIAKLPRFDGAAAWAMLTAEDRAAIGAIALEYVVNMHGEDAYFTGLEAKPEARPFIAGQPALMDMLMNAVAEAIANSDPVLNEALNDDAQPVPIPSLLGGVCRICRCSDYDACPEGCGWAEPDLCTACAESQGETAAEASANG